MMYIVVVACNNADVDYPAIATRKPAATMGHVMRRKMKRLMYTPTVRMNRTVSKVKGTMIFPITVAAFGHFHLIKRTCCNICISRYLSRLFADLTHIPRAVGRMRETRENISWPKGITSRP